MSDRERFEAWWCEQVSRTDAMCRFMNMDLKTLAWQAWFAALTQGSTKCQESSPNS